MTHETVVTVGEDLPTIRIVRQFDAPPAAVFRAHTDPDLFAQWVGPDSIEETIVDRWDCRTGGEWRYVAHQDGQEHGFRGCFHDVRPSELIVQTFTYEGFPDGVALERLELEELEGGRTRLAATSLMDSFEGRDAMVASGMEVGIVEGYRSLDVLLAGR